MIFTPLLPPLRFEPPSYAILTPLMIFAGRCHIRADISLLPRALPPCRYDADADFRR